MVAVVVDPTDAELDALVGGLAPDLIQLHGKESPERVAEQYVGLALDLMRARVVAATPQAG